MDLLLDIISVLFIIFAGKMIALAVVFRVIALAFPVRSRATRSARKTLRSD